MNKKLSRYIIPSVISMVLVGTYTNIDGFFIGNAAGDDGLAAINIVWPIVAFITALGTGIGVGGSVILNNLRGANCNREAESVKKTLIAVLSIVGIIVSILFTAIYKPTLKLMGASGQVLTYSENYSLVICLGAIFQILGTGLVVLLRNENKTYLSMLYTIIGLVVHIILDILLVNKYKLYGVAFSTVIAQIAIMIPGLFSVKIKKGVKICKKICC